MSALSAGKFSTAATSIMKWQGILSLDQLHAVVDDYLQFDSFVFDVETLGEHRSDPQRNEVFWVSLAGPGRADVIPCGHPVGERIPVDGITRRIRPNSKVHQERRINPDTGREKWFDIPEPFTPPPKQLWVSDVMEALKPLFFSDLTKGGHNVKFDLESIAKYYEGEIPPPPYGDTLVMAKLINENFPNHRLGDCVDRAFHFKYEKIGRLGPEKFPFSEAYEYSYLDAKYTWLLWQKLKPKLEAESLDHLFDLEMQLLPVIIDMEMVGTPIDIGRLEGLHEEFALQMAKLQAAINKAAGFEVNLNANRQVAELVYDVLGHTCEVFTATNERSVSKESLQAFAKDPVVAKLLEHAQLRKLQSTFVEGLLSSHIDGRIHPDFNQMGTVSGRLSCRQPNLQNQPSRSELGRKVRSVFVPSPGYALIVADLSQIELRVLAHFTQDPELMRSYQEGIDLHAITARVVFGDDFTDIQRSWAKNANFSVLYGSGPTNLIVRYKVPNLKTANRLLDAFYETYRNVQPWKRKVIKTACQKYERKRTPPYVVTLLGRKRRLPELFWEDYGRRKAAERQAISVTISGSAADLFKVIMINCHRAFKEQNLGARILMTIHDELVVEVPEEHADVTLQTVKDVMENVVNPFTGEPFLSVPIVCDGKRVSNWSEK
jgi:DNA polymerase I-like protein with 3'-5' exonuclease and polymerase domains